MIDSVASDTEDRGHLWTKTKNGLYHAMKHYADYDFFLKADDDTYTIVENLRFLLKDRDPESPMIMGRRWRVSVFACVFEDKTALCLLHSHAFQVRRKLSICMNTLYT